MPMLSSPALFDLIADQHPNHGHLNDWWRTETANLLESRPSLRSELQSSNGVAMGPLGFVSFSYVEMGSICSLDLFGLDELILFSYYWKNRNRYARVVDMGANIGLHSVVLARMGFRVTSYEPDPTHLALLHKHLSANEVENQVEVVEAAVASHDGMLEFVRVLGNTTGSHVAGAKSNPYGKLEVFEVKSVGVAQAMRGQDLVKMDVEGIEAVLLTSLDESNFAETDVVCEVGTEMNARAIFEHFIDSNVKIFSQKLGWKRVWEVQHMPTSHREGSIFLSRRDRMDWVD